MQVQKWKLGDPCYLADVRIVSGSMRFRVMPARVVHVAGINSDTATAQSVNPPSKSRLGYWEPFTEGRPYKKMRSAFAHIWREMRKNRISIFSPIRFEGEAPEMTNLPANIPELGQVVYGIDIEAREIFEAHIGYLRYEYGKLEVGYDQSPGNPEASNVRIRQWWHTRTIAELHVQQNYGEGWAFLSKEALAQRINAEIEKIWSDTMARLKSPQFRSEVAKLAESLKQM